MRSFKFLAFGAFATAILFTTACLGLIPNTQDYSLDTVSEVNEMGGGETSIHLPFPNGTEWKCVQGYNGDYSHQGTSTRHDMDFDTSNYDDEEIYAPVSGKVRVHLESATTNYGYHVNIDIGDGTYVVVAHLKYVFVSDGDEVAVGELLGIEGCTGACTGDHVHLGRHEGDASLQAQFGVSIESRYHLADATAEEVFEDVSDISVVCGLSSAGDAIDGHWYMSELPVPLWHPDGTLVMAPANPEVYLLEDGMKRWIRDEEIFWSHSYDFGDVVAVSDDELNCYGQGEDLTEEGLIAAYTDESDSIWLVVGTADDNERYRQMVGDEAWAEVLESWGLNYSATNPPPLSDEYAAWPELSWLAVFRDGSILKEESRSDVYIVTDGVAAPVIDWHSYLMSGYYDNDIIVVHDGVVRDVQEDVGDCTLNLWCLSSNISTTCGGGFDLADDSEWGGEEDTGEDNGGLENNVGDTGEEADADTDTDADSDTDSDSDADTDADSDADSDTDSDADTDADSDADSDTDADTDTGSSGYGIMTITWETDLGYNSQTLSAIYEYAPSEAEFEAWAGTTFTASNNDEITFSFVVPEDQTVRYSVEAYFYGSYDWSCESTSTNEADDELKGTHTIEFVTAGGETCDLTPSMYHKTAGTADGCEAMTVASCD